MEFSEGYTSNRVLISIRGIVQGVGFRPFVYREAKRFGIVGYVTNTSEGVYIDAQGKQIAGFITALRENAPERARIDAMQISHAEETDWNTFDIRESEHGNASIAIPLDTALCSACIQEMEDPADRRYRYPFINCTDCGPRYTIMQIPPYDRVRTSMKHFVMCEACASEYADPGSRRYHAEPISCPECGPELTFSEKLPTGEFVTTEGEPVELAAQMLKEGKIVALKGLGGFHLLCDATNDEAVRELRRRKNRPAKPLAVMFATMDQLRRYADITADEADLIEGAVKPIVIVHAKTATNLSSSVAPGIGRIGVFLPYTPLHRLLFESLDFPLVATSANISDEPILVRAEEVKERLSGVVDALIDHNRPIVNALDDAVIQMAGDKMIMLRMGRGYAPFSSTLETSVNEPVLALGAHQKNAIAPIVGRTMVLGGHIGDLGSIHADEYFERTIQTFKRFYDFEPEWLICDLHPGYTSTRYALAQHTPHQAVQHHYAHILAGMAEHRLNETVLGFAFDGTGYGEDGTLWGGEVMLADVHRFDRIGSLKPIALLGGDKAIREPRRIALSLLFENYTLDEVLSMDIPVTRAFMSHEIRQLHHMWDKKLNAPQSSSMGRMFDAVAALGGFIQKLDYEGQSGLQMEGYADDTVVVPFEFAVDEGIIDMAPMIREIVQLQQNLNDAEEAKRQIAGRFIATVDAMMHRIVDDYPELPVVVGGGVFQNRILMERLYRSFKNRRFYAQQVTPINDGGIALGQAWWGIHND